MRGMPADKVTAILVALLKDLAPKFLRADAASWLRENHAMETVEVEAMLHMLGKVPGVRALGDARYGTVARDVVIMLAKHRLWRVALPTLNLNDAIDLRAVLATSGLAPNPNLERLRDRLEAAVSELI